jgi:hypothetical protein
MGLLQASQIDCRRHSAVYGRLATTPATTCGADPNIVRSTASRLALKKQNTTTAGLPRSSSTRS